MMQANLQAITWKIQYLLLNWSNLYISVMGKANLIEIIIIPKVLQITLIHDHCHKTRNKSVLPSLNILPSYTAQ